MKITVLQENFLKAMQDAMKFIPSRPQIAILSCFYIKAEKGNIVLSATDLNMGIQISFGGKVEEDGECAVPAKLLLDVVSSLSKETITFVSNGEMVEILSSKTRTEMQEMSAKDFPSFPQMDGQNFKLEKKEFLEIVTHVAVASGIDETRPIFTSMLWDLGEENHFACTDGYRMALYTMKKNLGEMRLLIPAKLLLEVSRILGHSIHDVVEVFVPEDMKQIAFSFGNVVVFTRVIEGNFPNYSSIVPAQHRVSVLLDKEEFLQSVKSSLIFARETSGIVRFSLDGKKVKITSSSTMLGKHESSIDGKTENGEVGEIALNGKYITDFLSIIPGKDIWFGMNETLKPGEFRDTTLPQLQYIIMPFRVQG